VPSQRKTACANLLFLSINSFPAVNIYSSEGGFLARIKTIPPLLRLGFIFPLTHGWWGFSPPHKKDALPYAVSLLALLSSHCLALSSFATLKQWTGCFSTLRKSLFFWRPASTFKVSSLCPSFVAACATRSCTQKEKSDRPPLASEKYR
jgi:hypothetical protein